MASASSHFILMIMSNLRATHNTRKLISITDVRMYIGMFNYRLIYSRIKLVLFWYFLDC